MARYVRTGIVPESTASALLRPRTGLVLESPAATAPTGAPVEFHQREGPLRSYMRTVELTALPGQGYYARQTVRFQVGLPWWSWLLTVPVGLSLRRFTVGETRMPWWAAPARLDRRAACVVAVLAALSAVQGFMGGLLPETLTYAASEFRSGTLAQGGVFAAVQLASLPALAALVLADRRGRRAVVLWATTGSVALSELSAAVPSMTWLAAAQVGAGALLAAAGIAAVVVAVEEVPAGCRAWAVGVLGMAAGLGAGVPLAMLPLAGTGPGGWRWLYATSLTCLPVTAVSARWLPESRRWAQGMAYRARGTGAMARPRSAPGNLGRRSARRRLAVVCTGAALFALFATPAGQFQTQFLRQQRHYSAAAISGLQQMAGTVGGLGVLVGGRLADTRGRRPVGMAFVGGATAAMLAAYFTRSWPMWAAATVAQFCFYGAAPVLGVYGAELFATASRARSAGLVAAAAALGGVVGLLAAGAMANEGPGLLGGAGRAVGAAGLGPALAVLAAGPLLLIGLLARAYPETAGLSLEVLTTDQPADDGPGTSSLTPF